MTKPTKWHVRPVKTQISLGICLVWSKSSLCAQWVAKDPRFLHADSEDSDQTGRMPRLIWVIAARTLILLVLSWGGSFYFIPQTTTSLLDKIFRTKFFICITCWKDCSIGSMSAWHASSPEFNPHVRHILSWRLGHENMEKFLRPIPLFCWFKKNSCQLLAKECALSKLPRSLDQKQYG